MTENDGKNHPSTPVLAAVTADSSGAASTPPKPSRFDPLDVLRGLAVLGMALSGMVPYRTLPAWMYHAQIPPPTRDFNDKVFGITWVDLVFPFFLFSMGAAIPLALNRRIERGDSARGILIGLAGRGLLLAAYALIGQHLRPFALADKPDTGVWLLTLAGFFFLTFILIRWPDSVPITWRRCLNGLGWLGSALAILWWNYPDGARGFANYRSDIILMVLANVAVSGGAIWVFTRARPAARWVCFAVVATIFLTNEMPGLGHVIWNWDPTEYLPFRNGPNGRFLPILYHFEFHKYLLIVIPGTFVGDLILRKAPPLADRCLCGPEEEGVGGVGNPPADKISPRTEKAANFALSILGPASVVVACVGLLAREVVWTTLLLGALLLGTAWLLSRSCQARDSLAARIFMFGAPLLFVGLLCEPLGGGIRKDEATISYFLVSAALSALFLGSLANAWPRVAANRVWRNIADVGINPIMGYLIITNLVWAIVGLTGLEDWINGSTDNPWLILLWGFVKTVFVALSTAWFTRRRIFLRA